MSKTPQQTVCTAIKRANMRHICFGIVAALALGVGFSSLGGYMVSDFASFSEPPSEKTYLVTLPDDEELLRNLSTQLTAVEGSEASTLNSIAPAAGSPLGTLGE